MALQMRAWCSNCHKTGAHDFDINTGHTTCRRCGGIDTYQEGNHGEAFMLLVAGILLVLLWLFLS